MLHIFAHYPCTGAILIFFAIPILVYVLLKQAQDILVTIKILNFRNRECSSVVEPSMLKALGLIPSTCFPAKNPLNF